MFVGQGLKFRIGSILNRMRHPNIGGIDAKCCRLHVSCLNEFRRGNADGGNVTGLEVL